jgi:hypothetical protein
MPSETIQPSSDLRATALAIAVTIVTLNEDSYRPFHDVEELTLKRAKRIGQAAKILLDSVSGISQMNAGA